MTDRIKIQGNRAEPNSTQINNVNLSTPYTNDDIDRDCLRTLRCPDTLVVKNRLKENKDRLLYQSIEWIRKDPQYTRWQDGDDYGLLWIKGGAGKGKTMMSIGLVEQIPRRQYGITIMTYFFCQNADYELNTIESIIKGLILQLVHQQEQLTASLRRRWNTAQRRFDEAVTWRMLWNIFLEMLDRCQCQRVYVVIDALDECEDGGMADFFKLIVRTGLQQPSKIKWLLTSRPLDSAERELLAGADQVLFSLELNSEHVAEAVKTYIAYKTAELDRRQSYGLKLRQEVETELTNRAEETYLWVSLACKRLEDVHRDQALKEIQKLPPGLPAFYRRIFGQLCCGESIITERCLRLLKAMMLTYRPLDVIEVRSVTGFSDREIIIEKLVDRCASLIKMRGSRIEFVHQSARDYLDGTGDHSLPNFYDKYGHSDVALNCITYLWDELKVNLINLPQPDSTRDLVKKLKDEGRSAVLAGMDYAATFWVQHLKLDEHTVHIQNALSGLGKISQFLQTKLLEWLECLSLLDQLLGAVEAFQVLLNVAESSKQPSLSIFMQDATRFWLRHYQTITTWPLQIYSSAILFSPQASVVRTTNLDKIPQWLKKTPLMENKWASLIQTLVGHSDWVTAVAFSQDGKRIASGSGDTTIKVWNATTGDLKKTLAGHLGSVTAVALSPDGKRIASGSSDTTIKVWDATTGDLEKTLAGHSDWVIAVVFSPDGKRIASGSGDTTIKVWDATTGDLKETLAGHSDWVTTVAFSQDGKRIASGSNDTTIRVWDAITNDLEKTLAGHSDWVTAVVFSPDGKRIASGSNDTTIKVWDATTGDLEKTLVGHSSPVLAVAFSPDGKRIASGSGDTTIKVWDAITDDLEKTLAGHSDWVTAVVFSPDGKRIASGSYDKTIKVWDATTGDLEKTLAGHSGSVIAVAFSQDGKRIASGSGDKTIKIWDVLKSLKASRLVGRSIASRVKFKGWHGIAISEVIDNLIFSVDGLYLLTNIGPISVKSIFTPEQKDDSESSQYLYVNDQWLCYETVPILRLQLDSEPTCYDTSNDRVAIGFRNGRVLSFDIDRLRLYSTLEFT